jgi:dienelactone hydrolase
MISLWRITIPVLCAAAVAADTTSRAQDVTFTPARGDIISGAFVPDAIPAALSIPSIGKGPFPAVVIVHGSGGLVPVGPERSFVVALNGSGIATLVLDMWTPRGMPRGADAFGGTGGLDRRPSTPQDTLPDAFGALKYLGGHPLIDRGRIGIMGFSWGAMVSLLAADDAAAGKAMQGEDLRFAAHSGNYLVCWPYRPGGLMAAAVQTPRTGRPMQIHVAGHDDYDDADGGAACRAVVDSLPLDKAARPELFVHEAATHMWDFNVPVSISFTDRRSHVGVGGTVHVTPDPALAAEVRENTVAFFKRAFGL